MILIIGEAKDVLLVKEIMQMEIGINVFPYYLNGAWIMGM